MNRRHRRRQYRRDRATVANSFGRVLHGACRDCHAVAVMEAVTERLVVTNVYHDTGCPAAAGVTPWSPVKSEAER